MLLIFAFATQLNSESFKKYITRRKYPDNKDLIDDTTYKNRLIFKTASIFGRDLYIGMFNMWFCISDGNRSK